MHHIAVTRQQGWPLAEDWVSEGLCLFVEITEALKSVKGRQLRPSWKTLESLRVYKVLKEQSSAGAASELRRFEILG